MRYFTRKVTLSYKRRQIAEQYERAIDLSIHDMDIHKQLLWQYERIKEYWGIK